jgi:hypothetical protein
MEVVVSQAYRPGRWVTISGPTAVVGREGTLPAPAEGKRRRTYVAQTQPHLVRSGRCSIPQPEGADRLRRRDARGGFLAVASAESRHAARGVTAGHLRRSVERRKAAATQR